MILWVSVCSEFCRIMHGKYRRNRINKSWFSAWTQFSWSCLTSCSCHTQRRTAIQFCWNWNWNVGEIVRKCEVREIKFTYSTMSEIFFNAAWYQYDIPATRHTQQKSVEKLHQSFGWFGIDKISIWFQLSKHCQYCQ